MKFKVRHLNLFPECGILLRRVTKMAVGSIATALLVVGMSHPAAAAETDTAVSSGTPTNASCITELSGAEACFKPDGDILYVLDTSRDGHDVYAKWDNQLRDSSGSFRSYRTGSCRSSLGYGNWAACNKDFYEDSSDNAYGGNGSRILLYACVDDLGDDSCTGITVYNRN